MRVESKARLRPWAACGFHAVGILSVFAGAVYGIHRYLLAFGGPAWQTWLPSVALTLGGMIFTWVALALFLPKRDEELLPSGDPEDDDLPCP